MHLDGEFSVTDIGFGNKRVGMSWTHCPDQEAERNIYNKVDKFDLNIARLQKSAQSIFHQLSRRQVFLTKRHKKKVLNLSIVKIWVLDFCQNFSF